MDANSFYEQHLSAEEALAELMQYHDAVKSVNGTMITVWHNNFLGTDRIFAGWKETYRQFVSSVKS